MHHNDITIVCRNIAIYAKFCKVQLGEGVNAILKKVGLYLQNDSISTAIHATLLNLLANYSLDIVLSSDGMV